MEEGYDSTIYREGRSPTSRDNNYEYSNPNNSEEEDEEESSYNHQTKRRKHALYINLRRSNHHLTSLQH